MPEPTSIRWRHCTQFSPPALDVLTMHRSSNKHTYVSVLKYVGDISLRQTIMIFKVGLLWRISLKRLHM